MDGRAKDFNSRLRAENLKFVIFIAGSDPGSGSDPKWNPDPDPIRFGWIRPYLQFNALQQDHNDFLRNIYKKQISLPTLS